MVVNFVLFNKSNFHRIADSGKKLLTDQRTQRFAKVILAAGLLWLGYRAVRHLSSKWRASSKEPTFYKGEKPHKRALLKEVPAKDWCSMVHPFDMRLEYAQKVLAEIDLKKTVQAVVLALLPGSSADLKRQGLDALQQKVGQDDCSHLIYEKQCVPCIEHAVKRDLRQYSQKWAFKLARLLGVIYQCGSERCTGADRILWAWRKHPQQEMLKPAIEAWAQCAILSQKKDEPYWSNYFARRDLKVSAFPSFEERIKQVSLVE